jgi:hypothetical protein
MITLRDLAARSGRGALKSNEVWTKLNNVYQKKAIPYRFGDFNVLNDFCVNEEEAYEAIKAMRPVTKAATDSASGNGRGRGRGRGRSADASSSGSGTGGGRGNSGRNNNIVRYLPRKYENMAKARDPAEAERIRKDNLCFACRQPGHGAGHADCPFNMDKGRYAFADIPREMTKAEYDNL